MDYDDPAVWESLDPARQQVHLLLRIAEDTKDIRAILRIWWLFFLAALVLLLIAIVASYSN